MSYKNVAKVMPYILGQYRFWPLATGYWQLVSCHWSLAVCLWVGQKQEASSQ
jgi:hypothetical protein